MCHSPDCLTAPQHGISRAAGQTVRTEEARQQELRDIDAYKELVDLVNTKVRHNFLS